MIKRLIPFLLLVGALNVKADTESVGIPWGGLNNGDASFQIGDNEAQGKIGKLEKRIDALGKKKVRP